ncbi:MAG: hypothetical protein O3A63_13750 [Proteobacteria bacterium]|nr:hypothetical protein [Pseudomonadota bacterium]
MAAMKVFVPFAEDLFERLGTAPGDLVPFRLEYEIFHAEVLSRAPCDAELAELAELTVAEPAPFVLHRHR